MKDIETVCIWANDGVYPDSKVHGANMGSTWVLSAPDGPHVGSMNLAIKVLLVTKLWEAIIESRQILPYVSNDQLHEWQCHMVMQIMQ